MSNESSSDMDLSVDDLESGISNTPTKEKSTPAVPEKYKGKTVEDIIAMHQNAERKLAEQGNELGNIRKLVMQPITEKTPPPERAPVTVEKLVDDPDKAILDVVSHSPVAEGLDRTNQRLNALDEGIAFRDFSTKHKAWQSDITDQTFLDWVQKNPVRVALAGRADNRDFRAASNLWDMWDEHKDLVKTMANSKEEEKDQKLEAARTTRQGGTEPKATGTVYSSAKLMDLRRKAYSGDRTAQDRWAEIQPDLIQAYKENRVK